MAIMPKSVKTKRSIEFYLTNFTTWLNNAEYDPAISGASGKKIKKVNLKYDPKENIAGYTKELSSVLNDFIIILKANPYHHEKLAKETKKRLGNLHRHLDEILETRKGLPKGKTTTIRALQKTVSSSLKKTNNLLSRIVAAKYPSKVTKAKGYINIHHRNKHTHLRKEMNLNNKKLSKRR